MSTVKWSARPGPETCTLNICDGRYRLDHPTYSTVTTKSPFDDAKSTENPSFFLQNPAAGLTTLRCVRYSEEVDEYTSHTSKWLVSENHLFRPFWNFEDICCDF